MSTSNKDDSTDEKPTWAPISGSDLKVEIDSRLVLAEQKTVSQGQAESILAERLRSVMGAVKPDSTGDVSGLDKWMDGTSSVDRDLAEVIVDAIGDANLNETLLKRIDLRPYLMQMAERGDVEITQRTEGNLLEMRPFGGEKKRTVSHDVLTALIDGLSRQGSDLALATAKTELTPEQIRQVRAESASVNSKKAGISPEAQVADMTVAGQSAVAPDGSLQTQEQLLSQEQSLLPAQEAVDLFMMDDSLDVSRLWEAEKEIGSESTMFSENELTSLTGEISSAPRSNTAPAKPTIANGVKIPTKAAAGLIASGRFTPTQVTRMQKKLLKAGYFDGLDAPVMGDVSDIATSQAWRRALGDRVRTGTPLPDLLADRSRQRMGGQITNDMRTTLDLMARQTIGRGLSQLEMDKFVADLHGLKGEQMPANADGSGSNAVFDGGWFTKTQAENTLATSHAADMAGSASEQARYQQTQMLNAWAKQASTTPEGA